MTINRSTLLPITKANPALQPAPILHALAQLLGLLLSPATKLVRLLNEPGSALARLLRAKAKQEGKPAEASA